MGYTADCNSQQRLQYFLPLEMGYCEAGVQPSLSYVELAVHQVPHRNVYKCNFFNSQSMRWTTKQHAHLWTRSCNCPWPDVIPFDMLISGLTRLTTVSVKLTSGISSFRRYLQSTSCRKSETDVCACCVRVAPLLSMLPRRNSLRRMVLQEVLCFISSKQLL